MYRKALNAALFLTLSVATLCGSANAEEQRQLRMNRSGKTPGQMSQLHQEYQARLKKRKQEALALRRQYNSSKDYSRVGLSHRIDINIANPSGVFPWGNAYRPNPMYYWYNGRWYRRSPRPIIVIPAPPQPCSPGECR